MLRILNYAILFTVFSAQIAVAQTNVRVRTGQQDDYSRLVFDLSGRADYELEQENGKLTVSFKKAASLSGDFPSADSLRNISGFDVVSENPLKVSINVPSDSRVRDFFAGDRLILDVYNSPSSKQPVRRAASAPTPPKAKPTNRAKAEDKKVVEVAAPKTKPRDDVKQPDPSKLKAPKSEEKEVAEAEEPKPLKIEKKSKANHNLISFSDTKSFGMAVFDLNGEIILVNDSEDFSIPPQASGPQSKEINPLNRLAIEGASAFKLKQLEGFQTQPSGGGLLWRIAVSDTQEKRAPVDPIRIGVGSGGARGATLLWPFDRARKVFDLLDPRTGEVLKIVTVDDAKQFAGPKAEYVDFEVLSSPVGLAVLPKVDDLEVVITSQGVEVSRPTGLTVVPEEVVENFVSARAKEDRASEKPSEWKLIFDFKNWKHGEAESLEDNRNVILAGFDSMFDTDAVEGVITLAKMHLANGMGFEALGFLELAKNLLPGIEDNIEFAALKGAARAFSWRTQRAFFDLSQDKFKPYPELEYWRAFALADLGDWQQAGEVMPRDFSVLFDYPDVVFNRLALTLAEIALRAGEADVAKKLLSEIEHREKKLLPNQKPALAYLQGEASRQNKDYAKTKKLWKKLTETDDDLYRTRASLALTRLKSVEGDITPKDAINNLERLRYAWRGDQLEAQINYWLGRAYFDEGQYAKGLNILREATTYAAGTDLSRRIASDMTDIYAELFLGDKLAGVSPLDAAALYEQFSELVPVGDQGNQVVERLAERLVQADLLPRAAELLQKQLDYSLEGFEAYRIAVRLAVIKLMDDKPAAALKSLQFAEEKFKALPEESQTPERARELDLLTARAQAFQGRPDLALEFLESLEQDPEVNRLRADIAWHAKYWDDAAHALHDVILDEEISLTRPLEQDQAALILQRAVALNLATDRIALANMREKYTDAMTQTNKAKIFEVVTRPRQSVSLADRETLSGIVAETDLFSDFLKNYGDYKKAVESN